MHALTQAGLRLRYASPKWTWNTVLDARPRPFVRGLGAGWELGADIRYQSKVETFFSLFDQYCVLNARVQKRFRTVSIFLEGRDLLDDERTTTFESADRYRRTISLRSGPTEMIFTGQPVSFSMKAT